MKDEALYVYDELAKLKLIEPDFHRQMKGVIEASEMLTTRDLFSLALDLSIAGMVRTSASFGFDEEHLTASFAGSLASNLTWFARAYQKAEGKRPLPELKWVHQTKVSEARLRDRFRTFVESAWPQIRTTLSPYPPAGQAGEPTRYDDSD